MTFPLFVAPGRGATGSHHSSSIDVEPKWASGRCTANHRCSRWLSTEGDGLESTALDPKQLAAGSQEVAIDHAQAAAASESNCSTFGASARPGRAGGYGGCNFNCLVSFSGPAQVTRLDRARTQGPRDQRQPSCTSFIIAYCSLVNSMRRRTGLDLHSSAPRIRTPQAPTCQARRGAAWRGSSRSWRK